MMRSRPSLTMPLLVCLALGTQISIGSTEEKTTISSSATKSLDSIVFVPHDFGAPEVTVSGGVRGRGGLGIELLAPPKFTRTMSATPTFYWYVDGPIDVLRFTITSDTAIEPILEITLEPAKHAGIYSLSLADHDVALEQPGVYRWSIAAHRSNKPLAAETVAQTVFGYEGMTAQLPEAEHSVAAARLLAEQGYWYDLIDLISRQTAARGASSDDWAALRTRLLAQHGLHDMAAATPATVAGER